MTSDVIDHPFPLSPGNKSHHRPGGYNGYDAALSRDEEDDEDALLDVDDEDEEELARDEPEKVDDGGRSDDEKLLSTGLFENQKLTVV